MKELLSNEEIDSLLELFRAESGTSEAEQREPTEESERGGPQVSPLDLLKPNRFGRERLSMLERLFASIAKGIGGVFGERLRTDVATDCVSVEQVRFASWRRQLEGPIGIWTVAMPPFASPMLLTMTGGLLRASVDRLLGGSGRVDRAPDAFTTAELAVAEGLVEALVERIASGFADVVTVRPRVEGRSGSPAMVQAMAPADVALGVYFQVAGAVLHGDVRLSMAYQDLEPYLDRAPQTGIGAPVDGAALDQEQAAVARAVRDVPFDLSVLLGRTTVTMRSLLGLRPGDVLRLDSVAGEPLEGVIEGVARLRGDVVKQGSARGFRVGAVLGEETDDDQA